MKRLLRTIPFVFLAALIILSISSLPALAHERRTVGKYQVVVGWIGEPAFEGQKNGVDFRVTTADTQQPVLGLEQTVQVEITHVPSGVAKVFALRTIFNDPGHYTADLIFTDAGYFKMRFFGDIEGLAVNETFNSKSGGGGYNDVQSTGDIQFPTKVSEVREVEAVARHIEEENHDIEAAQNTTRTMSIIGISVGALGLIIGGAALVGSRRKAK